MKTKMLSPFLKSMTLIDGELPTCYPFNLPIFANKQFSLKFEMPITFIVGENGSGKSTILESIAYNCGFNIGGGNRNHVYQSSQNEDVNAIKLLNEKMRFGWLPKINNGFFMRAESFYNFINYTNEVPDQKGFESNLHFKSHGEAFLTSFEYRMQEQGIFLFDEPEAALSPTRQLKFLKMLHKMQHATNSQFIIITHSPIIMSYPEAIIYNIEKGNIKKSSIKEVEHYQVVKDFINNPDSYLYDIMYE